MARSPAGIYLDHNATCPPLPAALEAAADPDIWANPSSVHRPGQLARHKIELARRALATMIGADPKELVLTGSGTESINLGIRGVLEASPRNTIVTSSIEHEAVRDLTERLEAAGTEVRRIAPGTDGIVRAESVAEALDDTVALVSVMWANNETGAIQPAEQIGAACRAAGVPFHCDGTQWVGKMPTDLHEVPIDLLTFSPHKFGGLKGVGALAVRRGVRLRPQTPGAQELGRRGGTENTAGIAAAGAAAQATPTDPGDPTPRDRFESLVLAACPGSHINGPTNPAHRLWNTTNLAFPTIEAEAIVIALSERGVHASAGAACSSGSLDPSPVLLAMGVSEASAHGSVRFSFGRGSTVSDAEEAARTVAEVVLALGGSSGALSAPE
ncbi:MAG: cysteine desulfurase family protein [Planctomycetota bacterium]